VKTCSSWPSVSALQSQISRLLRERGHEAIAHQVHLGLRWAVTVRHALGPVKLDAAGNTAWPEWLRHI